MSADSWTDRDISVDIEEHQQMRKMCKELRKEKNMLKESLSREQAINAELIRRFEKDITAASELHQKDRKYIEKLEREVRNRSQEIVFLQEQLNITNTEANCIHGHADSIDKNPFGTDELHQKLKFLEELLVQSDYRRLSLMRELDQKEIELENSALQVKKLEADVSSIQLESQFEIESMKLEITTLEQRCFEAERFCEQAAQEKGQMDVMFHIRFQEAQEKVGLLEKENKEMQKKLILSERSFRILFSEIEKHLDEWLKQKHGPGVNLPSISDDSLPINLEKLALSDALCNYEEVLRPFLSKLAVVTAWDENVKNETKKMSNQIRESECLVSKLKEELREEKLKAKEEAEDLTQEMAELRYQITEMLEEEHSRRALIEQASIQRIQELESEVHKERLKYSKAIKHFHEAKKLAKARAVEVRHLRNSLEESCGDAPDVNEARVVMVPCPCRDCVISRNSIKSDNDDDDHDSSDVETSETQAFIGYYSDADAAAKGILKYGIQHSE